MSWFYYHCFPYIIARHRKGRLRAREIGLIICAYDREDDPSGRPFTSLGEIYYSPSTPLVFVSSSPFIVTSLFLYHKQIPSHSCTIQADCFPSIAPAHISISYLIFLSDRDRFPLLVRSQAGRDWKFLYVYKRWEGKETSLHFHIDGNNVDRGAYRVEERWWEKPESVEEGEKERERGMCSK